MYIFHQRILAPSVQTNIDVAGSGVLGGVGDYTVTRDRSVLGSSSATFGAKEEEPDEGIP
jgi:hypothetical protein